MHPQVISGKDFDKNMYRTSTKFADIRYRQ